MRSVKVAIVGGGPGGASCARTLTKAGISCIVVDKMSFPRQKVCAGWVTPGVFRDLEIDPEEYPGTLTSFSHLHIRLGKWPILLPGTQYAVRRMEFDDWLIRSSGAELLHHEVKEIQRVDGEYILDGQVSAEYLVGAGGTYCPVRRLIFRGGAVQLGSQIVSLEEEYAGRWTDPVCRLWFFEGGLPGYAWYVPKAGGYINLGIGANAEVLKSRGESIKDHWERFIRRLIDEGKIEPRSFQPSGYTYYLQAPGQAVSGDHVFLVGDSAGLATLDMGEGIGPAVKSGIAAAKSIVEDRPYELGQLPHFSLLPSWLWWLVVKLRKGNPAS